jgi:hypothetical protein
MGVLIRKGVLAAVLTTALAAAIPAAAGAVTVTLTADKTAVKPGTTINLTAVISATPTAHDGGINSISDSIFGVVDGQPTCITSSGPDFTPTVRSFTCVYSGKVAGRPGSIQSHTLTAVGVEDTCGAPPLTPGGPCPPVPPPTSLGFVAPSNAVDVRICRKKQKLRKGKCVKKR